MYAAVWHTATIQQRRNLTQASSNSTVQHKAWWLAVTMWASSKRCNYHKEPVLKLWFIQPYLQLRLSTESLNTIMSARFITSHTLTLQLKGETNSSKLGFVITHHLGSTSQAQLTPIACIHTHTHIIKGMVVLTWKLFTPAPYTCTSSNLPPLQILPLQSYGQL